MNMLSEKIGFGCGRLRGGFEESHSRRLVDAALACGIRYFDTAPAYGESERILGAGLRGLRDQVQLCSKVGLYGGRPGTRGTLRGFAMGAVRTLLPDGALGRLKKALPGRKPAVGGPRGYGNFDPRLIRSSLERSLEALETDFLDCLMLHEPRMDDPPPEVKALLEEDVRGRRVRRLGVGTHAGMDQLPPFGDVAQFALGRTVRREGDTRMFIGHGLFRQGDLDRYRQCAVEARVFELIPGLSGLVADRVGLSGLLLSAVILGTQIDRVLISSASEKRLRGFTATAGRILAEIESRIDPETRQALRDSVDRYHVASDARV
jgi:hypothetical protein